MRSTNVNVLRQAALGVACALFLAGCGSREVGRSEVTEEETTLAFHLDRRSEVQLWAEMEVTAPADAADKPIIRFPHIQDIHVSVEGPAGAVFTRRCSPFSVKVFKYVRRTETSRSYDGKLKRCRFAAEPGDYVLKARLVDRLEDDAYRIDGAKVIARAKPSDD